MSKQSEFQMFDQVTLDYGNVKLKGVVAKVSGGWPHDYTIHVLQKSENGNAVGVDYLKKMTLFDMYTHVIKHDKISD